MPRIVRQIVILDMETEKKVILIFGKRGSGKSYLTKKLIADHSRLLVFDIMSEYTGGVVFGTETENEFRRFWLSVHRGNFKLVYRPIEPNKEIEYLANAVFALGDMSFVVEEIDSICTAYDLPEAFSRIIARGRHKNITLIGVTPAPFGIHRNLTRQAKEIYIFDTNEPRDRTYLRNLLGQEIEPRLDALQQYEYVYWQDGKDALEIGRA